MIDTIRFSVQQLNIGFKRKLITFEDSSQGRIKFFRNKDKKGYTHQKDLVNSHIVSSSYQINYRVDINSNEAIFEFSISKYIYGHNLDAYPLNKEDAIYDLNEFLIKFFLDNFDEKISQDNIRILRIDICYNHVFESEKLKHQYKKLIIDNATINFPPKNVIKYENETVMVKYQNYSFKMYDKGLEFEKNDYKELFEYIKAEELKDLLSRSKKILRFEMTFRNNKISDLLMSNYTKLIYPDVMLSREIKNLKAFYNMIFALSNFMLTNINKYKKTGREEYIKKVFKRLEREDYKHIIFNPYMLKNYIKSDYIMKADYIMDCFDSYTKTKISKYNRYFNAKKFYLKISENERQLNKLTVGYCYQFNQLLFDIMFNLFNDKLRKLTNTFSFDNSSLKNIIVHNYQTIKDEMNIHPNKLINYLDNPDMKISKTTLYRYLESLKEISERYIIEEHNINFLLK
jgi:hypothetical protein